MNLDGQKYTRNELPGCPIPMGQYLEVNHSHGQSYMKYVLSASPRDPTPHPHFGAYVQGLDTTLIYVNGSD